MQVRSMEREALALQARAAFAEEGTHVPTVAEVVADFDMWLTSETEARTMTPEDIEREQLHDLVGVRRRI